MSELAEPLGRLLADACPPATVRAIEHGASPAVLWARLEASGFLDAVVIESAGGAGLALAEAFALFVAEGRQVLPVPMAHTMLVRGVLALHGIAAPSGSIAIASRTRHASDGSVSCPGTPCGSVADWIVVTHPEGWCLLRAADAERAPSGTHASLRADLTWRAFPPRVRVLPHPIEWRAAGAAIASAQIAGALEQVLQTTLAYAGQRVQFGRPIGRFQAIQHNLAVMAQQVAAARMAAEIGCAGATVLPDRLRAALAKARTSEAAALVANSAHAVHGAIGITAELDLQLYTRRLHEWRSDFGAETHWNRELGRALLDGDAPLALDFMRGNLIPPAADVPR